MGVLVLVQKLWELALCSYLFVFHSRSSISYIRTVQTWFQFPPNITFNEMTLACPRTPVRSLVKSLLSLLTVFSIFQVQSLFIRRAVSCPARLLDTLETSIGWPAGHVTVHIVPRMRNAAKKSIHLYMTPQQWETSRNQQKFIKWIYKHFRRHHHDRRWSSSIKNLKKRTPKLELSYPTGSL